MCFVPCGITWLFSGVIQLVFDRVVGLGFFGGLFLFGVLGFTVVFGWCFGLVCDFVAVNLHVRWGLLTGFIGMWYCFCLL